MIKKNLEIHSENILPIIKKWLYSSKDIFIRELVSNSCDAIHKVKILNDHGTIELAEETFSIEIRLDKQARTIQVIDNGIGMSADEVQKYIAQIAFSGAEEFVEKYQSQKEADQIIGHFGLGFYSAYMVASKVDIDTLSYQQGAEPVFWSCDGGSSEYEIAAGSRTSRGTTVTLHIDGDSEEFLDTAHLATLLEHYCAFLPYPIYLGTRHINSRIPLWIKAPADCSDDDYKEFYHYLYPGEDDPLFWLHLNVDYPFHLKGILYFPKLRRDYDFKKSTVKLFCNRVFVADNCKDVIPEYLMPLRGIIDSPDIPLNVSRSYLQMDRTVRQLGSHIAKKVSDSLIALWQTNRQRFLACWDDVSLVVKLGAIEDEKFYERIKELLLWKNIQGEWTTLEGYIERNSAKTNNKVFYTRDEQCAAHLLQLYRQQGIEVLCAGHPIDVYLIQFLERKQIGTQFQRCDSTIDATLLDTSKEKVLLDASGKSEAMRLADLIRAKLSNERLEVEAKSLANGELPAFIVMDEGQRRLRDYLRATGDDRVEQQPFLGKVTFVINTNSALITALPKLEEINPELAKEVVQQTYELALLSQREIDSKALNAFIGRTSHVLEKLAVQATAS